MRPGEGALTTRRRDLAYSVPMLTRSTLAAALWLVSGTATAQVMIGPSDDVEGMLNSLTPGDEAILADGTYSIDERFYLDLAGTEAEPIVIRAADGARPHFVQNAGQNIWDLDVRHVVIRGLEFSGGSAGLRFQSAEDVTIEDCEIHDTGDVGLRMNDEGQTYARVHILRNHIHDTHGTGEGMYLGCNRDGCRLADSEVRGNYVHHTNAADVIQGDGIELKEGSYGTVIADNVIHDTRYPCLLGYGTVDNGAPNVVERNVMWSCGAHGIQWAADAVIRNNIVLGARDNGIACQLHQSESPSDLVIVHNTVFAPSNDALTLRAVSGDVVVANNALYAQSGRALFAAGMTARVTVTGNVGEGAVEGVSGGVAAGAIGADFVSASYGGAPPLDASPTMSGALFEAGDTAHVTMVDFNGLPRMGVAHVGAYGHVGANPGWTLQEGFKPAPAEPMPGTDAGPADLDAGAPMPGTDAGGGVDPTDGGGPGPMDGGAGADTSEGCSCRAVGPGEPSPVWLVGPVAWAVLRRRRRAA